MYYLSCGCLRACVRAYAMRRADGGRSQTLSPSSTPPRCASVPMETGGFPALRQSRRLSLRAESPGQGGRADTTYPSTHSPQEKVRKTRLSSCGAVSPRTHAGFRGFWKALAAGRKTVGRRCCRAAMLEHFDAMKNIL